MSESTDINAAARQRLLVMMAVLFEALHESSAVQVLRTLRPHDMRSGGARVPGTSYELEVGRAAEVMRALLALQGYAADALVAALAQADIVARLAALTGQAPPQIASLYAHCTRDLDARGSDSLLSALRRLYLAAERIFTLTHMRRINKQCLEWKENPSVLDQMPVQQFVASFIRNTP